MSAPRSSDTCVLRSNPAEYALATLAPIESLDRVCGQCKGVFLALMYFARVADLDYIRQRLDAVAVKAIELLRQRGLVPYIPPGARTAEDREQANRWIAQAVAARQEAGE